MKSVNNISDFLQRQKKMVDEALDLYLPTESDPPALIHNAMRYSVFAGGKRLRPILTMETAKAFGANGEHVLPAACAVECIHTYSLIHDDLPAMDDDERRRGKLTNHKVFGEAIAILAGDALLSQAFVILSTYQYQFSRSETVLTALRELAYASGSAGLVGGQVVDIIHEGEQEIGDLNTLEFIHSHKTGALLVTSMRLGALLAGCTDDEIAQISSFAAKLGLAYQITDDILDIEGNDNLLGKSIGKDKEHKKLTYPSLLGLARSKSKCKTLLASALEDISFLGSNGSNLRSLANYLIQRKY